MKLYNFHIGSAGNLRMGKINRHAAFSSCINYSHWLSILNICLVTVMSWAYVVLGDYLNLTLNPKKSLLNIKRPAKYSEQPEMVSWILACFTPNCMEPCCRFAECKLGHLYWSFLFSYEKLVCWNDWLLILAGSHLFLIMILFSL